MERGSDGTERNRSQPLPAQVATRAHADEGAREKLSLLIGIQVYMSIVQCCAYRCWGSSCNVQ